MKDKKRIMCSGLAFSDHEDMEMLHQYAKEGWIFRKMRGLHYILYREEPQSWIFSYDMQKLSPEEKDDYFRMYEESGWHILNPQDDELYFFYADEGTIPLHSEAETRMETYRPILKGSVIVLAVGVLCLLSMRWFQAIRWLHTMLGIAGSALSCVGALMVIGIGLRMRKRRLHIVSMTFRKSVVLFVAGIMLLYIRWCTWLSDTYDILLFLGIACTLEGLFNMCFQYRKFKDKKEIHIKKKDEGVI